MSYDIRIGDGEYWMVDPRRKCAGRPDEDTKPSRRAFGIHADNHWLPKGAADEERAKKNCDGCMFKKECLQSALDNNEEGVWGGTTGAERAQLLQGGGSNAA